VLGSGRRHQILDSDSTFPYDHGHTLAGMIDQTYLVRLKPQSRAIQHVAASIVEVLGGHLVFLDAERRLAAVFLLDLVESWEPLPRLDGRP
jgi:hypothetical protein